MHSMAFGTCAVSFDVHTFFPMIGTGNQPLPVWKQPHFKKNDLGNSTQEECRYGGTRWAKN